MSAVDEKVVLLGAELYRMADRLQENLTSTNPGVIARFNLVETRLRELAHIIVNDFQGEPPHE